MKTIAYCGWILGFLFLLLFTGVVKLLEYPIEFNEWICNRCSNYLKYGVWKLVAPKWEPIKWNADPT